MAKLSRHLLFAAEPNGHDPAENDIFPPQVRPPVLQVLRLGLLAMLALLAVIVLVWRIGGV